MRRVIFVLELLLQIILGGCLLMRAEAAPCDLNGEMQAGRTATWEYEFTFTNRTQKTVRAVEFMLSLFDGEGEGVFECGWLTVRQELHAEPYATFCGQIALDDFFDDLPDEPLQTDFFYASRIEYTDGTSFEDVFGRYAF